MGKLDTIDLTQASFVLYGELGYCILCKVYEDLRMKVCAGCAKHIDGEYIKGVGHKLWDTRNISNSWWVYEN